MEWKCRRYPLACCCETEDDGKCLEGRMKKSMTWETLAFYMGIAGVIAAAGAAAIVRLTPVSLTGRGTPCFLNTFFHIPCPGCGGTRAIQYLLEGRFLDSFLAHPLVLYTVAGYLYFMVCYGIRVFVRKESFSIRQLPFGSLLLAGAALVTLGQWLGKLALGWA